jgi:hypothetical protein
MAKTAKKLNDDHRAFLVREMACFSSPQQAAESLSNEYGVEITPQSAQHYDATSFAGRRGAKKWQDLFKVARAAFLEDVVARVPEAQKSVRIQKLAQASRKFEKNGNYLAMANMLERIAKEVGNVHTNRHEFTGKDGGPIRYQDTETMTDEQIIQELKELGIDYTQIHAAPKTKQ